MTSVSGEQPRGHHDVAGSDAPTPPHGVPMGAAGSSVAGRDTSGGDDATPPTGIPKLSAGVTAEDYGRAAPTVLGGNDPVESHDDAGDWPTLEYRSRRQQSAGRNWLGRRRGTE